MRYTGVNRIPPRGVRTHVALIRTLRSYIETHLLDLVDINKFEPIVGERADDYGRDDVVEAHIEINGQNFQFHIEGRIKKTSPSRAGCWASCMSKPA